METVAIVNGTRGTRLGERIRIAETSLSRMVGLLGKPGLNPGDGLLIIPSQAVHTIGMRFAIDVVFVGRNWRVVHVTAGMTPYRITAIHWRSSFVIELPTGVVAETQTHVGDQLVLEERSPD
jgi:uncharacterized membrane protein (UPF0127 family)